jgi:hypothetical protein
MSGEEHQVVGEDSKQALPLSGLIRPGSEGTAEPPFVPAERGLDGSAIMPPKVEVGWPSRPATGPVVVYRAGRGLGFFSSAKRALFAHVRGSW